MPPSAALYLTLSLSSPSTPPPPPPYPPGSSSPHSPRPSDTNSIAVTNMGFLLADSQLIVLDDAAMSLIGQFTSHLFHLYFPLSSLLYNKVSRILWRLWWNEVRRKTRNNDTELEYPSPYAISYPCFFKNVFCIPVSSKMNFTSRPFSSRRMTNIAP